MILSFVEQNVGTSLVHTMEEVNGKNVLSCQNVKINKRTIE